MNFLNEALGAGATDLHLTEGEDAFMRVLGKVTPLGPCATEDYLQIEKLLQANTSIVVNEKEKVKDFSLSDPLLGRIRIRRYYSKGKRSLAIRFLPSEIPTPSILNWPVSMYRLCELSRGLVLVTGPTGSGKTTTLAAMLEAINTYHSCHIVTLEAPIEYELHSKQSLVHQCEVPDDIESFTEGARAVLRLDPDVVMIGELTDAETMRAVLKLAESGHLVFATMHTASSVDAIEYFVNHFEASEQQVIRHQLANVLQAVVAQRLLVRQNEKGLIAAYEVLLRNTALMQQIKSNDLAQLSHTLEAGRAEGMCVLEDYLARLVRNGEVRMEAAMRAANNPEKLRQYLEQ